MSIDKWSHYQTRSFDKRQLDNKTQGRGKQKKGWTEEKETSDIEKNLFIRL